MPKNKTPELEHTASLITYNDEHGEDTCLGALFFWPGQGCFDPTFGEVDVTQEEAEIHNRLLDEAMLSGLDNGCEIGQGALFCATRGPRQDRYITVTTFNGTPVGAATMSGSRTLSFSRGSRQFRGVIRKDQDAVFFRRIS
jgi:hypothetical protein